MVLLLIKYNNTVVPLLKDTLERTPLCKGHKFLAASTVNAYAAPSHQRNLSNKDIIFWQKGCPY